MNILKKKITTENNNKETSIPIDNRKQDCIDAINIWKQELINQKAEVGKKYWYANNIIALVKAVVNEEDCNAELRDVEYERALPFNINGLTFAYIYPYEHSKKNWLEVTLKEKRKSSTEYTRTELDMYEFGCENGIIKVCKKILEEVKNNCFKSWMPQVSEDVYITLKKLIKDLGVEV